MTDEQKRTLTICLEKILKFYEYGKQGCIAESGGFARLFRIYYPEHYEENKDFIWFIDDLVMACYRAGLDSPPDDL